jgi:hypothetical protein
VRSVLDVFGERPGTRFRRVVAAGAGALAFALAVIGVAACSGDDGDSAGAAKSESRATSSTTSTTTVASESSTGVKSGPPAASTAVSVPGVDGPIAGPFAIDATGDFGNGVTARLSRIEAINATATLPGEFSGPAVALRVEVTNRSARTISLGTVIVDLVYGDNLSAYPVTDPKRVPLSGDLAAGDTTAGDYVFTIAPEARDHVQVRIRYAAEKPTIVFTGSVAG